MSKKSQGLLVVVSLVLSWSNAYPLPLSQCVIDGGTTQTCELYESDEAGNRSKVSAPLISAGAPIWGSDWAPRWVLVYSLTRKNVRKKKPDHVVVVTKPVSSPFPGLFADSAILYTKGGKIFKGILQQALAAPACNEGNTDTIACTLIIDKDLNGVATFQQPFVWSAWDPNTTVEGVDTIHVRTGKTPQLP